MNDMNKFKSFIGSTIAVSTSAYSEKINMDQIKPNGFGGIAFKHSGSGTATISIEVSNDENPDDTTASTYLGWVAPVSNSQIATGVAGNTLVYYTPNEFTFPPCKWLRFKIAAATNSLTNVILKPVIQ